MQAVQSVVDLRSDTVTRPTKGMMDAMCSARVGDDVFEDDPTVNALEEKAAGMFGKEAGLFCASGTMTNQIAIKAHTQPGDDVICDKLAHIYTHEGGGIAFNSGASVSLLNGDRGRINATQVKEAIKPDNVHYPHTRMVALENTVNRGGGCYYDLDTIADIKKVCDGHGLILHLDGARIFNALVATGAKPADHGQYFDTISVCLSKGMGCPVGSVLLGTKQLIKKARRIRKVMGGGWRQAGFLAAAGIYSLDHNIDRLAEDHKKAAHIADVLKDLAFVESMLPQETNIVIFKLRDHITTDAFQKYLAGLNIWVSPFGKQDIRITMHLDISEDMVSRLETALKAYKA
jgi:threonine aldolase